ncbi:MAG: biopolymer transporter ExbD [Polyangiaceae bacterium]
MSVAAKASVVKFKAELRKARRRNAREPEIDFLNITAMLDLMTIILVFVLNSLASSTQQMPQNADLTLPISILETAPSQEGVVVRVSKTQLLVGDERIADFPNHEQLSVTGIDQKDLKILADKLRDYRESDKIMKKAANPAAPEETSEAILVVDRTTPYRLLLQIVTTLGNEEFGKYHLMALKGNIGQ